MTDSEMRRTGGCLCGALRYELLGRPLYAGYCYCGDCRKASGSGFIPFLGYASHAVRFDGQSHHVVTRAASGRDAVRNVCAACGSLVFGGVVGQDSSHTIYAGSLDDPSGFTPTIAIFTRDRPSWAPIPPGLTVYDGLPDHP